MDMDFRRPKQPVKLPQTSSRPHESQSPIPQPPKTQPVNPSPNPTQQHYVTISQPMRPSYHAPPTKKHALRNVLLIVLGVFLTAALVFAIWFFVNLQPVNSNDSQQVRFDVAEGESTAQVADSLASKKLIRNSFVFQVYAKINDRKVEAGAHLLSPSQSVAQIAMRLGTAENMEISVQIPPGLTLDELREVFKEKYGYSDAEIDAAYAKTYDSPLFADKPEGTSLEGYIFPDTYNVYVTDSLDTLLQKSFDTLYSKISSDGTMNAFSAEGLSVYEGLTLASIVQKEVTDAADQKLVAGVFFNRLNQDIQLGSDVTFMYAAKQMGVTPTPLLDSPYNTRLYKGLPPGPISNMKYSAIEAVVHPTESDYLYFVAGEDGKTYYAVTSEEHEENIRNYCGDLCR